VLTCLQEKQSNESLSCWSALERRRLDQKTRSAAHRFNSCLGGDSSAQLSRVARRDATHSPQYARPTPSRLAVSWVPQEWFERYSRRIEEWRIPGAKDQQENVIKQIREDGSRLLTQLWSDRPSSVILTKKYDVAYCF